MRQSVIEAVFRLVADEPEFVLVDKSPGVSFHSESGEPGLFEQVRQALGGGPLYPVHRLDRITSGLLLMAKTERANLALCQAFAEHRVEKFYLALSDAKPSKKQGLILGDMARSRRGQWKLLRSRQNPAITQFFSTSVSSESGERVRAFLLKPHSGKTHQIRVAMKSLASPILGDDLYGGTPADRGYLHAYGLRFALSGKSYQFVLPPGQGTAYQSTPLREQLDVWQVPWALPWPALSKR